MVPNNIIYNENDFADCKQIQISASVFNYRSLTDWMFEYSGQPIGNNQDIHIYADLFNRIQL